MTRLRPLLAVSCFEDSKGCGGNWRCLQVIGPAYVETLPPTNVGAMRHQEVNEELTTSHYVQRFDSVPQFWQFLKGLRADDLIVELIQNDLDANAKHTSISFEPDRLVCQGDGEPVEKNGWERLSYVMGAGDQVVSKQFRIGVKNHGLKACFSLGDDIVIRSDGLRMDQTLYMDGPNTHPSPGTSPYPGADESAPPLGCSIEVPYRTKKLHVSKGEPFELDPTNENYTDDLFLEACSALPVRLMGVVCPGVRDHYTLNLSHHKFGSVEIKWRAKRPKRVAGKRRAQFTLFSRECQVSSDCSTVSSETLYEQACAFKASIPKGTNPEIPEFFQPQKRSFRTEIAWATDRNGRPAAVKGVRRYPIGYAGTTESALSRLGVHFSGPYRSDGERHGVSGQDPLNAHIDEICRDALVDIMACYLLPRHGARVMELYAAKPQPNEESLLDMLSRANKKKAIPLQPTSGRPSPRRKSAAGNKEQHWRSRAFLGPRRNPSGGTKEILVPTFTWDGERWSSVLSELCPEGADQIDKSVPPTVLRCVAKARSFESMVAFDEQDVIDRLQNKGEDCVFAWKDDSEWRNSIGNAATVRKFLDVAYLTIQNGKLEDEGLVIDNVHLPDSNSELRPLRELHSGVKLPAGLQKQHVGPILHDSLGDHRLLRRPAWKPKPFTIDDYLDHADLGRTTVDQRRVFWRWLRGSWKQLRPQTLRRLAMLPVWPNDSGCPRKLNELCEPQNKRIASLMGNALDRPSREILSAGMVKNTGRSALTLRRMPSIEEVENFLSAFLATFPEDRALSLEERKRFRDFEAALTVLATVSQFKSALEELGDEHGIALNGEGFLKNPSELVSIQGTVAALHLPVRHIMDRPESILDRVKGWSARLEPSSSQIEDALREDGDRTEAHVQRLQMYVRQSKSEGNPPNKIRDLPCIPVEESLYLPSQLALRGQRDFWGSWKTRIPLSGISPEVQQIYKDVGVVAREPDQLSSRQFFEWLRLQPAGVISTHTAQVLRHIQHRFGPCLWESTYPAVPFIPVEGSDGQVRLVTRLDATIRSNRIVIPDFEPLQDRIRASEGNRLAELAIVESRGVREPITSELLGLGLHSLKELAREPVSVTGEGDTGDPPSYLLRSLNALQSGAMGQQLPKRLDRLGITKDQNKLRSNMRERLSGVKSVKVADTVTAKYRLARREIPVETAGRLDRESGILWLRSGPEIDESFFDVIADLIFEQPQQYLGSVLQRACKIELRERNPSSTSEEDDPQNEPDNDETDDSTELTSTTGSHPLPTPDPSKNSPRPGPIPPSSRGSRNSGKSTRTNSNRTQPADEQVQIADLKENQYAWHCQACLSAAEPKTLAPTSSYAFLHQNRRQIMEAHHCDQVAAGGARHAGNLLLLCNFHHLFLGDAVSRAEIVRSFQTVVDHTVVFQSGAGSGQMVLGKLVKVRPPQRENAISLFFTLEHLEYWKSKASEEGIS